MVEVDPDAARERADEWLRRRGITAEASIASSDDVVRVELRGKIPTTFLRVIGIRDVPVGAEATARPLEGGI